MESEERMKAKFLALCAALALTACQLPTNVSPAGQVARDGLKANFRECAVSVAFSDEPRALHAAEAAQIAGQLGRLADRKWRVDGLLYEGTRIGEAAFCMCSDQDFTDAEISRGEASLARGGNYKLRKPGPLAFARRVVEGESKKRDGYGPEVRMIFPAGARRCAFLQSFATRPGGSETAQGFFATLKPYP